MTTISANFRPYAAPANLKGVLERVRARNLPETINGDFLRVAGMPDSVFGRVTQALRFLGLIHEDGRPTDVLHSISGAPEAEYRKLLEGSIREAYREDFGKIDPSEDAQPRIIDAFMPYQPRSQTTRMVMLFLGLCREAGIPVLDAPRERSMKQADARAHPAARGGRPRKQADPKPPSDTGLLFGVTHQDIADLGDEFDEVWAALGKVAKARAKAQVERGKAAETDDTGLESSPANE